MIHREPREASGQRFDLLVIGGGIYGATLLLEGARRGLRCVLVERGDFGGATTWSSMRILHGGLRYLQSGDLRRFLASVRERRRILRCFPELCEPLPCLLALYGDGLRSPAVLRAALVANDLLSAARNRGVETRLALPRGHVLDVSETLERCPLLPADGLRGGAVWFDGSLPDAQRLVLELLHWASACGGSALNYVEAVGLGGAGGPDLSVECRDHVGGEHLEIRSRAVVNCAGPWWPDVAVAMGSDHDLAAGHALGFNLLLAKEPPAGEALGLTLPRGGGTVFLRGWKGMTLAGTFHGPAVGEARPPDGAQLAEAVEALRRALPAWTVNAADVLRVHWGLLPTRWRDSAVPASRPRWVDHGRRGGPDGLFSVSGVKLTTAWAVAKSALGRVARRRRLPLTATRGPQRPPPAAWTPAESFEPLLARDPEGAAAEARCLIESESVLFPDDLLLRRTDWGCDPRRGRRIARLLAPLLGWQEEMLAAAVERLGTPRPGPAAPAPQPADGTPEGSS